MRTWHRAHVIRGKPKGSSVAFGDRVSVSVTDVRSRTSCHPTCKLTIVFSFAIGVSDTIQKYYWLYHVWSSAGIRPSIQWWLELRSVLYVLNWDSHFHSQWLETMEPSWLMTGRSWPCCCVFCTGRSVNWKKNSRSSATTWRLLRSLNKRQAKPSTYLLTYLLKWSNQNQ